MSIEDIDEDIMQVKNQQMCRRKEERLNVAKEYFNILESFEKGEVSEEKVEILKNRLDELQR